MTRKECIKWLKSLKTEIGKSGHQELWHYAEAIDKVIEALSADAEPTMTEEVREALMRLTMCAREECDMCKYKDKCGFEFQYNISTENMNTILDALSAEAENRLYIKIYADDEPSVKAEKLYQICDETQNKEVAEWLKEYFPSIEAVQGEWIVTEHCSNEYGFRRWLEIECPFCGERPTYEDLDSMNFCPNCGARMTPYKGGDTE